MPGEDGWKPGDTYTPPRPVEGCTCNVCSLPYEEPDMVFRPYAVMKANFDGSYVPTPSPSSSPLLAQTDRHNTRLRELTREEYAALEGSEVGEWSMDVSERTWYPLILRVLDQLLVHQMAYVFDAPVDPIALNIPDYRDIIKHPMDLGTVKARVLAGEYVDPEDAINDIRRTFHNCFIYNGEGSFARGAGATMSNVFERALLDLDSLGLRQ